MAGSSRTPHAICAQTSVPHRYTSVYSVKTLRQPQGLLQDAFLHGGRLESPLLLWWEVPGLDS